MSRENVEIVREFSALFEAGDRRLWRSYFDPNVIWDTSESGILPSGVYRGHAGVEQFFRDWLSTWDDYAIENREFIDGGDAVAVVFRQWGRGKGSGINAERDFYGVYCLRDGKVIRYRLFASRTQALEAVGLRE